MPITPLEFDIQARSFADGFSRVLTDLLARPLEVGVRMHEGRLYTLICERAGRVEREPLSRHFDFSDKWKHTVEPATRAHARFFAAAGKQPMSTAEVGNLLVEIARRMTKVTYDHHTLLLPARLALAELTCFCVERGLTDSVVDALSLLAGRDNATTRNAQRLWQLRGVNATIAVASIAQEGDGYGIAHPGWLEDPSAAYTLAALYASSGASCSPGARMKVASVRRDVLHSEVARR